MTQTTSFLLFGFLAGLSGCASEPANVVFEIDEKVNGLIILIDDQESRVEIEKKSDSYHLFIDRSGVIKIRNLAILDGRTRLTTTVEGNVVPSGFLFYSKPQGATIFDRDRDLSFERSNGPEQGEQAMWKYVPSSIINGVSTHAFFFGTLDDAKKVLNEMRDKLVASTKEQGKKFLISPEEFERRQRENP